MNPFSASDVLKFAILVEEDGELFYRKAANFAEDDGARRLFIQLADQEVGHQRVFKEMLEGVGETRPPESYAGEYMAYLREYIDNRVIFSKDAKAGVSDAKDTKSALRFAMQRELDSVLYYQEVKQFVPQKHFKVIDGIIEEERKHFAILSELLKKYEAA